MSSKKNEAKKEHRADTIPSSTAHRALLKNSQTAKPAQPDFTKRRPGSLSRSILVLILSAICHLPSAHATITVTGLVSQITSEALETKIMFTPAADILLLTNGLSAGPAKTISSAANGGFTNTFNPGTYLVRLPLVGGRNAFTIAVPHGNGIENITNLIAAPWTYEQFTNTVTSGGTSGALTNNDTRAVRFTSDLSAGRAAGGDGGLGDLYVGDDIYIWNSNDDTWVQTFSMGDYELNVLPTYGLTASKLVGAHYGNGTGLTNLTAAIAADTVVSNGIVTGLAAGSYDINTVIYGTNILFGRDSALLSRGKHLPSRAYDYLPGHGSIDFQSPNDGVTTNRMAYVESLYSSILGGIGNRITNALVDFPGSNSVITGGYLNIIENGASCIIGNGENNYIGAIDTSTSGGESQSSFIGGGKSNTIFDGHESVIVGGNNNTNNSSEGFIGAGLRNIMESTQGFIGAGHRNKTYFSEGSFIGAGAYNFITNSLCASILGVSNIVTFSNSVTLGVNLTNANYTLMAGVGTNFFAVSPNGGVTMRGSGGDTNLLRFTSTTLSRASDTFYTNIERRAFIQIRVRNDALGIAADVTDIRLEIDQDHNGSWEETENRFVETDPGAVVNTEIVLSDYLQPNARYRVVTTNSIGFGGGGIQATRIKYF